MPWEEYRRVLNNAARFAMTGEFETAAAGEQVKDVLARWGMEPDAWLAEFHQLDYRCKRVLGAAHRMAERAGQAARRWFHGIGWCREIFSGPASDTCT